MKYTEFVKQNYSKVSHLPPKQRLKAIGAMWKQSNGKGTVQQPNVDGKGFDIFSMLGLGLEKKKKGRPTKKQQREAALQVALQSAPQQQQQQQLNADGSGFFDSMLGTIGGLASTALQIAPQALGIYAMTKGKGLKGGALKKNKSIVKKPSNKQIMEAIGERHRTIQGAGFDLMSMLPLLTLL